MSLPELPLLDGTRCTGCGDCVLACPTSCLCMAGPLPWLARLKGWKRWLPALVLPLIPATVAVILAAQDERLPF